ncbi:MAG: DUF6262 family protein [Coriobacteriales bacterium]|nr:DUF6262 family protein [Coriobacteriales bacterium]
MSKSGVSTLQFRDWSILGKLANERNAEAEELGTLSPLNTAKIIQLAKEKTAEKEKLALETIGDMKKSGQKVTFYSIAKNTGLSKTFLYNNSSVRQEIEEARTIEPDSDRAKQDDGSLGAEQLLASIEQMKADDPESYKKLRTALLDGKTDVE